MVLVRLLDDNYKTVALEDGSITHLPDNVWNIEIGLNSEYDDMPYGCRLTGFENLDYKDLTKVFRCSSRKLRSISIYAHATRSPDYFSFLVSAAQSTVKLLIKDDEDFDSDVGFSCLMSGLLHQNGPKTLHLNLASDISAYQAQLLFEGVAHSSCLEILELEYLTFEDREASTNSFVDALTQNRSLKVLDLDTIDFANDQEIFRAAILDAKVRSIIINDGRLDLGFALEVMSSNGCQLQSLTLVCMDMRDGDWDDNPTTINTSVKEVDLLSMGLHSSHLAGICAAFKSITKLRLDSNKFDTLSPLDTLLIGDNLKLQNLSLGNCKIDESCIIDFFQKLPQMTYIRRIELHGNPFLDSHEWMDVLLNAVQRTTSLECIFFAFGKESSVERRRFYSRFEVALSLNRAWRRFMENGIAESSTKAALPSNLWPLVLERATKISYFACAGLKGPTSLKADVVFWLLRERMVGEVTFAP